MTTVLSVEKRLTWMVEDGCLYERGSDGSRILSAQNTKILKDLLLLHCDDIAKAALKEEKGNTNG